MSHLALPLQFLNLGGEMMYILDQRLNAQNICQERANKVRNDILSIMLSQRFVEELFHPQPLYSKPALRTVFHKLAHASIMKLNAPSMDKLFDLMLMSLKHQVVLAPQARDLFYVTLNHIDSMAEYATYPEVKEQVHLTRHYFLKVYTNLHISDWYDIRRDLLLFVQDIQIRVSIFLKTGIQDHFGNLIIPTQGVTATGCEVPGTIRFFNSSGEISLLTLFPNGGSYACAHSCPDTLDADLSRDIALGLNIYKEDKISAAREETNAAEDEYGYYTSDSTSNQQTSTYDASSGGREELNLLAQLIGRTAQSTNEKEFKLSFVFNDDASPCDREKSRAHPCDVIKIDKEKRNNAEIGKIIQDFTMEEDKSENLSNEPSDLLELLDSV